MWLDRLAETSDTQTRSISAENPNGAVGGGAMQDPEGKGPAEFMGRGWKVRPLIGLPSGETTVLADIEGPGTIQHIWLTVEPRAYRGTILRMYWDGEETPSVEVPLGDFFCNGHGVRCDINSIPISVNPSGGMNSYWPMPFRKHARITIENTMNADLPHFYFQITYALGPVADSAAYFHAQWRRSVTDRAHPDHLLLETTGRGHYVGTYLAWSQLSDGWWGEGEVKFYIDGDKEFPTICGTGTEDYVGGAWCFGAITDPANTTTYSTPFLGYPQHLKDSGKVPKHGLYRWHVPDPVRFTTDLRVTIQAIGWYPDWKYQPLADDIASVSYWYQAEPHGAYPEVPGLFGRLPR